VNGNTADTLREGCEKPCDRTELKAQLVKALSIGPDVSG
jgi:hypothetical protein